MKTEHWKGGKALGLGFLVLLAVAAIAPPAHAFVGETLWTVNIPGGAQCSGSSGTAVAVVPGGKINLPKIQTVLITSCDSKLFFIDPSTTTPATPLKTLTAPSATPWPAGAWESLALRPDKVDLIGCVTVGGFRRSTRSTSTRSPPTPSLTGQRPCSLQEARG